LLVSQEQPGLPLVSDHKNFGVQEIALHPLSACLVSLRLLMYSNVRLSWSRGDHDFVG